MNIPDYVSPMIGHRVWEWDGSRLISLNGELWPSGRALEAVCGASLMRALGFEKFFKENELRRHPAPQVDCLCGIYAAKNAEQLAGLGFRLYGIRGEVHLWGTIIEHSLGWRAQFAYPKGLVLSTDAVPPGTEEAESFLAALTAYGADISLANGETDTHLWTKRSGYHKDGLDALRIVANRPIETALHVAVFADKEERVRFLRDQIKEAQMAKVVLSESGFPLSATDPIIHQLRGLRVRVCARRSELSEA
jgi:hypothetical protein